MNLRNPGGHKLIVLAVSWAAVLNVADAVASTGYGPDASISVQYSRVELERNDGIENVYRRIQLAARSVCEESDTRDLTRHNRYRKCYSNAVDAAVAQIGDAGLTSMHHKMQPPAGE